MKYIIAILVLGFIACNDPVTFNSPQPTNAADENSFPEKLMGNYLSEDKYSILTIDSNSIVNTYDYDEKEHKDSLDTSYVLKGDTIFSKNSDSKEKVVIKGDTLLKHVHFTDTLFTITDSSLLRYFKGYYFLNIKSKTNSWVVQKLSLQKGKLTIGHVSDSADLHKLQEITGTVEDTITIPFSLTRRQFKKFLRNEGFSNKEVFTKITLSK